MFYLYISFYFFSNLFCYLNFFPLVMLSLVIFKDFLNQMYFKSIFLLAWSEKFANERQDIIGLKTLEFLLKKMKNKKKKLFYGDIHLIF